MLLCFWTVEEELEVMRFNDKDLTHIVYYQFGTILFFLNNILQRVHTKYG